MRKNILDSKEMTLDLHEGGLRLYRNKNKEDGRKYTPKGAYSLCITLQKEYKGIFTVTPEARKKIDEYEASRRQRKDLERMAS